MKLLGNPWIVGLLGLGAVVVVVFNTFHPSGPRYPVLSGGRPSAAVVVNSPPILPGSPDSTAATPAPTVNIDLEYVRNHFTDWLTTTQRDPFFQEKPLAVVSTNAPLRQINQLKLKAIWRQDGVSMAAIDNGIYRQGDNVDGRKVQRIDRNGVWLENNGKREFVVFDSIDSGTTTNGP